VTHRTSVSNASTPVHQSANKIMSLEMVKIGTSNFVRWLMHWSASLSVYKIWSF